MVWSDNTDGQQWRTYSWAFDPTDSDHTVDTRVYYGDTDNNDVIRDDNASYSNTVTNKTGNYGLTTARTGLHGGSILLVILQLCKLTGGALTEITIVHMVA